MNWFKKVFGGKKEGQAEILALAKIPAGSFLMGSPDSERYREDDEVQHDVVISRPFLMCATPCNTGGRVSDHRRM